MALVHTLPKDVQTLLYWYAYSDVTILIKNKYLDSLHIRIYLNDDIYSVSVMGYLYGNVKYSHIESFLQKRRKLKLKNKIMFLNGSYKQKYFICSIGNTLYMRNKIENNHSRLGYYKYTRDNREEPRVNKHNYIECQGHDSLVFKLEYILKNWDRIKDDQVI